MSTNLTIVSWPLTASVSGAPREPCAGGPGMAWQHWIGEIMAGLTFVVLASMISFVAYTTHQVRPTGPECVLCPGRRLLLLS